MEDAGHREFDLGAQVMRWRMRQERTSSLSRRELDELEDHLRAHFDLEMELDPVLQPAGAFARARGQVGAGEALSREFARAGTPRWRRLFVGGWVVFAVSFLLPAVGETGYQTFLRMFLAPLWHLPMKLYMLPSLAMLMTIPAFRGRRLMFARGLKWFLGLAGIGALGAGIGALGVALMAGHPALARMVLSELSIGFWTWAASLTCVAAALRLRDRRWASARLGPAARASGQGVFE